MKRKIIMTTAILLLVAILVAVFALVALVESEIDDLNRGSGSSTNTGTTTPPAGGSDIVTPTPEQLMVTDSNGDSYVFDTSTNLLEFYSGDFYEFTVALEDSIPYIAFHSADLMFLSEPFCYYYAKTKCTVAFFYQESVNGIWETDYHLVDNSDTCKIKVDVERGYVHNEYVVEEWFVVNGITEMSASSYSNEVRMDVTDYGSGTLPGRMRLYCFVGEKVE